MATKSEKKKQRENQGFIRALSYCGEPKEAARIVGIKMEQAYRALADPDGLSLLEDLCKGDRMQWYSCTRAQRKSILTMAFVGGILPRVVFNEDGDPGDEIMYEAISMNHRFKALDMLNKMEGDYIDRTIVEQGKPKLIAVNTGIPRSPVGPEEEEDPLEL